MDLFDHSRQKQLDQEAPLAARMRPRTLDEFVGQEHIVGPGRLLRRAIQADQLSSLIFYGPPGTGKTTLARIIANTTHAHFIAINAVLAGVKDIREAISVAEERRGMYGQRTILFVDEVHRFNKAQQDALLPHVENGTVVLVGATTENPYFEVIKPLVSRSRVFELYSLDQDDLRHIVDQALKDLERGYGRLNVHIDADALEHLVDVANGDARGVLNALQLAVETTAPDAEGMIHIDLPIAEESIQRRAVLYDKDGDAHFDTISAFIKSLRGSDPDAALYWMARMLYAGEDPRFIFRRMLIFAGEDVGLADPNAIAVVSACAQAFDYVGLPEGRFHLAEACLYLSTAQKSNSSLALFDAISTVDKEQESQVPNHLKDANRDAQDFGHGQGYLYPHAYRDHWVAQQYLPENLQGKAFYQPGDQGYEAHIRDEVARRREAQLAAMLEGPSSALQDGQPETKPSGQGETSPQQILETRATHASERWLQRTLSTTGEELAFVRDRILESAGIERGSLILDLNAGSGLLTWEAVRRAPVGGVWALARDEVSAVALRQQAAQMNSLSRPLVLNGRLADLPDLVAAQDQGEVRFDVVIGRNALTRQPDKAAALRMVTSLLNPGGRLALGEVVPQHAQRLYALVDLSALDEDIRERLIAAEEAIYINPDDPMVNWDVSDLEFACQAAGLSNVGAESVQHTMQQRVGTQQVAHWFATGTPAVNGGKPTYALHLARYLSEAEISQVQSLYERQLGARVVAWTSVTAYLSATKGQTHPDQHPAAPNG